MTRFNIKRFHCIPLTKEHIYLSHNSRKAVSPENQNKVFFVVVFFQPNGNCIFLNKTICCGTHWNNLRLMQ